MINKFIERENLKWIEIYNKRYTEFGYDPKTLGWDKGKQNIRFHILTSQACLRNKKILDIGCGFGDLNMYLKKIYKDEYKYVGIDQVEILIKKAREIYKGNNIKFLSANFLEWDFSEKHIDYAIASGIFNFKFEYEDNYEYIWKVMNKAFNTCREGFAFDFLSDKVDFRHEHTFHSNPTKILEMAYSLSRNVILRNDYMPFEFSIFVNKDDSFEKSTTLFNKFENEHSDLRI